MNPEEFCNAFMNLPPDYKQPIGGTTELVNSALPLFSNLPMARPAVIEYFSKYIFERSISDYIKDVKKSGKEYDEESMILNQIQHGLQELLIESPQEYGVLICSWSIKLLGKLSKKYEYYFDDTNTRKTGKNWLDCEAARILLSLSSAGFCRNNEIDMETFKKDECVTVLLETYIKYTPGIDWAVSRLASTFALPLTTKVLYAGLQMYQKNVSVLEYVNPVIIILDQVALKHKLFLEQSFSRLQKWASTSSEHILKPYVIPYYMSLTISKLLRPVIYKNVLHILNSNFILPKRIDPWLNAGLTYEAIVDRMALMSLEIETDPYNVLSYLDSQAKTSEISFKILLEIYSKIGLAHRRNSQQYPLIIALSKDDSYKKLCDYAINTCTDKTIPNKILVRLLVCISNVNAQLLSKVINYLLFTTTTSSRLIVLIDFVESSVIRKITDSVPEGGSLAPYLDMTPLMQQNTIVIYYYFWKNLNTILKWERTSDIEHLKQKHFSNALRHHLFTILEYWQKILDEKLRKMEKIVTTGKINTRLIDNRIIKSKTKLRKITHRNIVKNNSKNSGTEKWKLTTKICDSIAEIIEMLDICRTVSENVDGVVVPTEIYQKCIEVVVKYFFYSLLLRGKLGQQSSEIAIRLLEKLCINNTIGRTMSIQLLIDGALFKHATLFGAVAPLCKYDLSSTVSLFESNIKQGFASQMSQRHLAVFRSGIEANNRKYLSFMTDCSFQRQRLLLEALAACCTNENRLYGPSNEGLRAISLWLVESISTDIMYNGLPWPEEEFSKVTIERDLHIRRIFQTAPILWSMMRFVAVNRPALCYCSVLLRGLTSVLIHQWSSWTGKLPPTSVLEELHQTTYNLIEVLSLGQLLPPPLNVLSEVIPKLNAFEISVVLRDCVWLYMKEHVPAPILFQETTQGLFWRDPEMSRAPPRFVESLRMVMQKHLPDLSSKYYQIFIQSEKDVQTP